MPRPADASKPSASWAAASPSPIEVVVKFTAQYNARAHRLLSEAGFAPLLYSCTRLYGGLDMVIMEFLLFETLWRMKYNDDGRRQDVPESVWDDVAAALKMLHDADIVFGDLRLPNIVAVPRCAVGPHAKGGPRVRAKLIDFDWAGTDGVDRYPTTLNHELDEWAPGGGVERYGVMRMSDDRAQLEHTKQLVRVHV